ncbi:hypothetical protein [Brevundimonas sp.]|uniref:hypothetical protein n=1 Tax=Brevundimonas sp. TaxID=1871086 RepID=UPI00391896E8
MSEQKDPLKEINLKLNVVLALLSALILLAIASLAGFGVRVEFPPAQTVEETA